MNSEPSNVVKFYNGEQIPLELHKVRVVQKLHLVPVERRLEAAHSLIKSGKKKVTEACFDVGFKNLSHFSKIYKEAYGVAPSW